MISQSSTGPYLLAREVPNTTTAKHSHRTSSTSGAVGGPASEAHAGGKGSPPQGAPSVVPVERYGPTNTCV